MRTTDTPPKPDRDEAILPSAGYNEQRATKHTFVEAVPGVIRFQHSIRPCHFFMFKCEETGAVRRYGFQ